MKSSREVLNRPVVLIVTAVNICTTLKKNGRNSERGELADRIPAHTGGVSVYC